MNFSKELITKAQMAKSVDELMDFARSEGIDLSEQNAQAYFNFLNGSGELSEADLDIVAGGKGEPPKPIPKYHAGQRFDIYFATTSNFLRGVITGVDLSRYSPNAGFRYNVRYDNGEDDYWYLETMIHATVYD